jgi:hypothetical protein
MSVKESGRIVVTSLLKLGVKVAVGRGIYIRSKCNSIVPE